MSRQLAEATENNFRNGLITEATALNFPENACTETYNCIFNFDGSVTRRPGFDFENDFALKAINRSGAAVSSFLWKNVDGSGDVTLVVLQVGGTIYFYEVDEQDATSNGAISSTVTLTAVSGAPSVATLECQYAAGNGKLFVTHPYCDPFYIEYDAATQTATSTNITVEIRDLEGDSADPYAISERPTATLAGLNISHKYNLYNQGWDANGTTNLSTWDTAFTTMPSNADVMWSFKNSSDAFDTATVANVVPGNSPAPKGHYILELADQDRDTASGLSGVTAGGTSYFRPSTCAFFTGRLFYSGVKYDKYMASIYFTQIVERDEQYGFCYQKNDPTSENSFDLLPDDGGVIRIQDAGNIIKLIAVIGGLLVFAEKGVWLITGSTGLGFTATDYSIQKISSTTTLSASSFVDIAGNPSWWTQEGIYMVSSEQNGSPSVKSITFEKIKSFYDDIPTASKANARGAYNYLDNTVQWIYKSSAATNPDEDYEYDSILSLNLGTGAFYPWTIPDSDVSINSIILLDGSTGALTSNNVVIGADSIVVGSDTVIAYSATNSGIVPQFAYIVSYADAGSYKFTFAAARNTDYLDWFQYDGGHDFTSYFISGYKLRGKALKKWQANWLRLYSRNNEVTKFYIKGLWDYSTASSTNRWSSPQLLTFDADNYAALTKRVKIRGHGLALQFMVSSYTGYPFDVIGWAELSTGNELP